jgi:hypothetical protein
MDFHTPERGSTMNTTLRYTRNLVCIAAMAFVMAGCASKEQKAIDTATKLAVATGQPQQVTTTDKSGNVTTTVILPPTAPGQPPQITTTTQPAGPASSTAPSQATSTSVIAPLAVNVPVGARLVIRIDQHISVKDTPAGSRFTGEFVEPVGGDNNQVGIPKGSLIEGVVDVSHKRGHFKGSSLLELRLTSVSVNGTSYPLDSNDLSRSKKGKGKRSAAMIGGGTGAGMLIGGVASGGVGLLVGGLIGGGAGTAAAGMTGNRDINIPAESVVVFHLTDPLVIQP